MKARLTLLAVLMLLIALVPTASATPQTVAIVSVDSYTVAVGQTFTVPVRIAGVVDLYGADVRLAYDPTMLQGVSVDHGNFLKQPWYVIRQGFWTWPGPGCGQCAWYALTQLRPALPVSGNGVLVYVTFRALQPGASSLGMWAQLGAADGALIPVQTVGGTVTAIAPNGNRR